MELPCHPGDLLREWRIKHVMWQQPYIWCCGSVWAVTRLFITTSSRCVITISTILELMECMSVNFALVFTSKSLIAPMESLPGIKLPTLIVPTPMWKPAHVLTRVPCVGSVLWAEVGLLPSCRVLQTPQKCKASCYLARACNYQYRSTAILLYTTDCTRSNYSYSSCS